MNHKVTDYEVGKKQGISKFKLNFSEGGGEALKHNAFWGNHGEGVLDRRCPGRRT